MLLFWAKRRDNLRTLLYIIIALLVLMIMVTIHEFGHYIVGKILKFKINEFSIGFGPQIYSRKANNGEVFSIRCIPLGGYCAFEGEENASEDVNAFDNQAPWKRILVLIAGGMFNIISGIIFSAMLLTFIGYDVMKVSTTNTLIPTNTYNLAQSDLIYSVEYYNKNTNTNEIIICQNKMTDNNKEYFLLKDDDAYLKEDYLSLFIYENILIDESGVYQYKIKKLSQITDESVTGGDIYIFKDGSKEISYYKNLTDDKLETARIVNTALKEGDVIYKVNGERVKFYPEKQTSALIKNALSSSNNATLTVKRDGKMQDIVCTGYAYTVTNDSGQVNTSGLGVGLEFYRYGFFEALLRSFGFTFEICVLVMQILFELITGKLALSAVGGPVTTIATIAGYSQKSLSSIFILMPLIAANLGVFNLMPIPALDGSKVIFCIIEWIRKKPINKDIENKIHTVGLFVLFAFVIIADFYQIFFSDTIRTLFG